MITVFVGMATLGVLCVLALLPFAVLWLLAILLCPLVPFVLFEPEQFEELFRLRRSR